MNRYIRTRSKRWWLSVSLALGALCGSAFILYTQDNAGIIIYDVGRGRGRITYMDISSSGNNIAIVRGGLEIRVLEVREHRVEEIFNIAVPNRTKFQSLSFHPMHQSIVYGCFERTQREGDNVFQKAFLPITESSHFCAHQGAVTAVMYSSAGDRLFTAGTDGTNDFGHQGEIRVWDARTSSRIDERQFPNDMVECFALEPRRMVLAAGFSSGRVLLFDEKSINGDEKWPMTDETLDMGTVSCLRFSETGERLAVAHFGGFSICDTTSAKTLLALDFGARCDSLAFLDSAGDALAVAGASGLVVVKFTSGEWRLRKLDLNGEGLLHFPHVSVSRGMLYYAEGNTIRQLRVDDLLCGGRFNNIQSR